MAWLQATPKPPAGSKRAKLEGAEPRLSRRDEMKRKGVPVRLPPNPMPHLTTRLLEIGLTEAAGMGTVPISWREINEWQRATGVELAPWEARLLRRLSGAYLAESHKAEAESCPAPWHAGVSAVEAAQEVKSLQELLG